MLKTIPTTYNIIPLEYLEALYGVDEYEHCGDVIHVCTSDGEHKIFVDGCIDGQGNSACFVVYKKDVYSYRTIDGLYHLIVNGEDLLHDKKASYLSCVCAGGNFSFEYHATLKCTIEL